ncbi:MAG: hypothetical protein WD403_16665, partial [Pirellulales bacterium]
PVMPPAASGLGQVHLLKRRFAMILHDRWSPVLSRRMRLAMLAAGLVAIGISPWPLRVAAEPPADADPAASQPAGSDAPVPADDSDPLAVETSDPPTPVSADTVPGAAPPADVTSVSEVEGEITVAKPVAEIEIGSGGARVRRTVRLKGPIKVRALDDPYAGTEPGSSADDDVHQRLARLEQMVAQLVQEMRTSRNPRRLDYEPGERYGAIRKRTKPEAADSGSVVEEDLFTPDPETRKPKRWQDARVENLMIERNRLRARLEEIERELGESAPVKR